jgi:hypothetical protein
MSLDRSRVAFSIVVNRCKAEEPQPKLTHDDNLRQQMSAPILIRLRYEETTCAGHTRAETSAGLLNLQHILLVFHAKEYKIDLSVDLLRPFSSEKRTSAQAVYI